MKHLLMHFVLILTSLGCDYGQHKIKGKAKVQANAAADNLGESQLPGALIKGTSVNSLRLTSESLKRSLSAAFLIPEQELCREANGKDCFDDVHLMALGGNLPEKTGHFEAATEAGVLSSVSLERVAVITCHNMVAKEKALGSKKNLLINIDLDAKNYSTVEIQAALSRSLLGRSLSSKESDILNELRGTLLASEYAEIVCVTLVTSTSFLFQ